MEIHYNRPKNGRVTELLAYQMHFDPQLILVAKFYRLSELSRVTCRFVRSFVAIIFGYPTNHLVFYSSLVSLSDADDLAFTRYIFIRQFTGTFTAL